MLIGTVIINLLRSHEVKLAELYRLYGRRFPAQTDQWEQLYRDEMAHAEVLGQLFALISAGNIQWDTTRFNAGALQDSIHYLEQLISDTPGSPLTPAGAIQRAIDLEQSILESNFFEVFTSDAPEIRKEFTALREHTREHLRFIRTLTSLVK